MSRPDLGSLPALVSLSVLAVLAALLPAAATSAAASTPTASAASAARPSVATVLATAEQSQRAAGAQAVPRLRVRRIVGGLDIPWDVQQVGRRSYLVTERDRARLSLVVNGNRRRVRFPSGSVWVSGETGLMSLALATDFTTSRRFYVCHGGTSSQGNDVRVTSYRLTRNGRRAVGGQVLLTGLPATSGRHGGCRLLVDPASGALYVGTGDAAVGTNPRDLGSLGGKVLRLDPTTGAPWPSNPFATSANPRTRYVLTFGHRNVQGLARRADGTIWSVEHGSYRDDEVNRLVPGGDYGWHPVPGYDESVPMTDQSLPGIQIEARWSSGDPTVATSGAAWVRGPGWGALSGSLAVAALKASRVLFLSFDAAGNLTRTRVPAQLRRYGRLRSVTSLSDGRLLITTSNGGGTDSVLSVRPR